MFSTLEFMKNGGNHHLGLSIGSLLWASSSADVTGISECAQFFSMCPPSLFGWKLHQFALGSPTTPTATNTGFLSKCLMLSLSLLRISELKGKEVFHFKRGHFLLAHHTLLSPRADIQSEPAQQLLSLPKVPVIAFVSSWDWHKFGRS